MSYPQRQLSPDSSLKHFQEHSTADKITGLEDSQRKYEELLKENLWLKEQIERKKYGHAVDSQAPPHNQSISTKGYNGPLSVLEGHNDMALWTLIERNQFLEEKLGKLRSLQEKQHRAIEKIEQSEEWQRRHQCGPEKCYVGKYVQLLRVRSPFF